MDFKKFCNEFKDFACVVSVEKLKDGYGKIRIVDGNDRYTESFKEDYYLNHNFIPNSIYTDYLTRNLMFEEYCYRSAVKKELLHSYAYPEYFKSWINMLFIPMTYETEELAYCIYVMEINESFNPNNLSSTTGDLDNKVLKTALQFANSNDFDTSIQNVAYEIRKMCNASFCCILLIDENKEKLTILGEDRCANSDRLTMKEYLADDFYNIVKSWNDTIANSNCIIINDQKGMDYVKEKNIKWYNSLRRHKVNSVVVFRLKSGTEQLGYMWVSNFKIDDTPRIKEVLEITSFILGFEISNHLLVDKLTELSSIDILTGLYNRTKMSNYMEELSTKEESVGLIFIDVNGLKKVNDIEGHQAGDYLIKRAASVLKQIYFDSYVFRVGGDEFVVILRNKTEDDIKKSIYELKKKGSLNNVSFAVGYSISNSCNNMEGMLKEADYKMYEDKRNFYNSSK